jgi:hypothetical protein
MIALFFVAHARATSIAVFVDQSSIIIAADSVQTDSVTNTRTEVCKIRQVGGIYYVATGEGAVSSAGFDLSNIAAAGIRGSKTLASVLEKIEPPTLTSLSRIVRFVKSSNPQKYSTWTKGTPVVSVAFASIENGMAVLASD